MRISDWSSDVCSSDLAAPTEPDRLGDIMGVLLFVGIDEDEVEGRRVGHCGKAVPRRADADVDFGRHAGPPQILDRDAGVPSYDLQRHQRPVLGQRPAPPRGRKSATRYAYQTAPLTANPRYYGTPPDPSC